MADLAITLEIKLDEVNDALANLKADRDKAVKEVIAGFKEKKKALFAQKAALKRMMKSAKKAEI